MISRLLLIVFCLVSFNVIGQNEDEPQLKEAEKFAVVLNSSPEYVDVIGLVVSGTSLGVEYRILRNPEKIFHLGVMGGLQYMHIDFFGKSEGYGFYTGTYLLVGRDHFFEIDLGIVAYDDRIPNSFGHTYWDWWPLISLGYRYESTQGLILKTGISTLNLNVGMGLKF